LTPRNRLCNIVLDSCCDLPREIFDSLGVGLLQFPFTMDDGERFDDLGLSMSPHAFYDRLRKGERASTSQIPYSMLLDAFEKAAAEPLPTVFLAFSSGLSSTFGMMLQILEETRRKYPESEIYVVDTLLASVAEGFLVWEAVRQAERGLSARELVSWVEEARWFVNPYFTLPDLETLRCGGRIPDVAALVGGKLDIKPILSFDLTGHLAFHGAVRGRKKAVKQLVQLYLERSSDDRPGTVLLASADAPKELKDIEEQLLRGIPGLAPTIYSMSVGPVIGAHTGPDLLALVFWGRDRRQDLSLTDRIANAVSGRKASADQTESRRDV